MSCEKPRGVPNGTRCWDPRHASTCLASCPTNNQCREAPWGRQQGVGLKRACFASSPNEAQAVRRSRRSILRWGNGTAIAEQNSQRHLSNLLDHPLPCPAVGQVTQELPPVMIPSFL